MTDRPLLPPPAAWWPPHHRPDHPHHVFMHRHSNPNSNSDSTSLVAAPRQPHLSRHAQPTPSPQPPPPATPRATNALPWSTILSPTLSISHFRLGELLGRGATSEVYAAFTDLPDFASLSLAIKRIPMAKLATAKDIARVQAEIQTQLLAQHPSIVRLYAAFRDQHHIYLVLELCESGTLADYLEARGNLTEPEVRYVLDAVIRGLLYLRRQGKFHRDVKPGNIMLTADNDVKIGDLGLVAPIQSPDSSAATAQRQQQQRPRPRLGAHQHTVCGTINYMAPEVVANQPYSETVDMWSLGCLLVTMLKGRPPFEPPNASNEDSYEVRIKTLRGLVDGHYTLPKDLSKEVRDLIASLLQKNPEHRMTLERILEHVFFAPGLPLTRLPKAPIMGEIGQQPLRLEAGGNGVSMVSQSGRPPSSIHHSNSHQYPHRIEFSSPPDPHQPRTVPAARDAQPDYRHALIAPPPVDPSARPPPSSAHARPSSAFNHPPPRSRPSSAQPPSIHSNPDRLAFHHPPRAPAQPEPRPPPPTSDLVPIQPLSTRYLRPISHNGQTVSLSLRPPPPPQTSNPEHGDDPDLDVHITSNRDGTHLTVSPSQHGRVSVYFPLTGESRTYVPGKCPGFPRGGILASLYEGARKFVAKAQGVSPRVTLYSPLATVALMVNGDVDARFADTGVRVKWTGRGAAGGEREMVQVWRGPEQVASGEPQGASVRAWQGYVAHVQMAARQCEAALAEHDAAVRRGRVQDRNAPLVIKTAIDAQGQSDPGAAPARGRPRAVSTASLPASSHATHEHAGGTYPRPPAVASRAPSTARSDSGYFTSHHGSASTAGTGHRRRSGSVVSTHSSVGSVGSSSSPSGATTAPLLNMFVPEIGWFARHPGSCEQYTLMFLDGALVTVQHSVPQQQQQAPGAGAGWVKYAPPPVSRGAADAGASLVQPRMYPLTQGLPQEVKERLGQYRVCVAEFRRLVKEGGAGVGGCAR